LWPFFSLSSIHSFNGFFDFPRPIFYSTIQLSFLESCVLFDKESRYRDRKNETDIILEIKIWTFLLRYFIFQLELVPLWRLRICLRPLLDSTGIALGAKVKFVVHSSASFSRAADLHKIARVCCAVKSILYITKRMDLHSPYKFRCPFCLFSFSLIWRRKGISNYEIDISRRERRERIYLDKIESLKKTTRLL
jgi:hypothetical protein